MTRKHPFRLPMVILDIETMATDARAVTYEAGALRVSGFPDLAPVRAASWYLDPTKQAREGRSIDPDTVGWMAETKGRMEAMSKAMKEPVPFEQFAVELDVFFEGDGEPLVWVRGPHFDISILETLYQENGIKVPWKFWKVLDLRTADYLYSFLGGQKQGGAAPHDALGDCRRQSSRISDVLTHIYDKVHAKRGPAIIAGAV